MNGAPEALMTTSEPMHETLRAQRAAFNAEIPVSLAVRKDRLRRLATMTAQNADRFTQAMSEDYGHRSTQQSMMTDIVSSVMQIDYALAKVQQWVKPERRRLQFPMGLLGGRAWIEYQPKGIVGVIAPWNFPVYLTIAPIAGAFAAGNRVMAKTSEVTPVTAAVFEEVAPGYFDRTELSFFSGGADVGERFASLPFDHLFFTGGTSVGRHILRAAAKHLVPVTLELGGKSPTIISRTADLPKAADRIAMGKMLNAGQICLAPDYAFVAEDQERPFVDCLRLSVASMYPTLLSNKDYSSVVNARHHGRLSGYLDDARDKGGTIVEINPSREKFGATHGNYKMPMYIVLNANDNMTVMREEIFGPILPVRRYRQIDEVIHYINAHDRPLALYYFGRDVDERQRVLDRTISGGVTIDDVLFHCGIDDLPFGGIGPAGMGSYHGIHGFRTFSHAKAIYRQGWVDLNKLGGIRPPYGKATMTSIERTLKPWRNGGPRQGNGSAV
jgi:coniferyl-aldehyde dehydrogenase